MGLVCDYVKPKYGEKSKYCYLDSHGFIGYMKTEGILRRYCRRC